MSVSAKDVMALRNRTGMGMMECKQALAEANGDTDAAIAILMKSAKGKMDDRTDRAAAQGSISVVTAHDGSAIAMVELNSETDFVARNDQFIEAADKVGQLVLNGPAGAASTNDEINKLIDAVRVATRENVSLARGHKFEAAAGQKIGSYLHHNRQVGALVLVEGEADDELLSGLCQHIAAHIPTPEAVDQSGLNAAEIEKAKQEFIEEAKASGKPAEIAEKMSTGKLRKWVDERTLVGQKYVRDMTGKTAVGDALTKGTQVLGFVRFAVGIA